MWPLVNWDEIHAFLTKFGLFLLSGFVAVIAKVSHELLQKRKLSWGGWMAVIGITLFWTYMSTLLCVWKGLDMLSGAIVVGLMTLLGERINLYIIANYKTIFERIISLFTPKR